MNIGCATDPQLIELLERAARLPPPTPAEKRQQNENWVIAEMGMGSDADEAAYSLAVATGNKSEIERLDKEAQERMNRACAYFAAQRSNP